MLLKSGRGDTLGRGKWNEDTVSAGSHEIPNE